LYLINVTSSPNRSLYNTVHVRKRLLVEISRILCLLFAIIRSIS